MKLSHLLALALGAASAAAAADPLTLRSLSMGESRAGLSVFRAELQLPDGGDSGREPWAWRPVAASAAVDQLVLAEATDTSVTVYGVLREPGSVAFELAPGDDNDTLRHSVSFDTSDATPGDAELVADWAQARSWSFRYNGAGQPLTEAWIRLGEGAYGTDAQGLPSRGDRFRDMPSAFDLFSGRAAITETLQQQLIAGEGDATLGELRLADLRGPQAASHPFDALLADAPDGRLEIAEVVPFDRWFVHIAQPAALVRRLDTWSDTGAELAALGEGIAVDNDLLDRYLARLNLSRDLVRQLAPLAQQVAVYGPDLYLADGAHVTVVMELADTALTRLLPRPADGAAVPFGEATLARHGRWVILSTSADEAQAALQLAADSGGSLGRSAEFRYMRGQLPAQSQDEVFVYLSDPLIRAMTGPRIKIAQYRRHQARARMELVTAARLLYRLDHGEDADLDTLVAGGYVQAGWLSDAHGDAITLDAQGQAHSSVYGTLAAMTPLPELDIDRLTVGEATGYQTYVDNYSRFWRTTFDPIAIRIGLDEAVTVDTLILPLIDNSVYSMVREAIGGAPVALAPAVGQPAAVTTLSLKRSDILMSALRPLLGDNPEVITDLLGDAMHITVYDSDPLIALGSADLAGALSGPMLGRGGRFAEVAMLGLLLTQPAAVMVELRDDTVDAGVLIDRALAAGAYWMDDDLTFEALGERRWVLTYNVENLVRFHLYFQQVGKTLVVSNRQMDFQPSGGAANDTANARLRVDFDAIDAQAQTLHLHHMQRQRKASEAAAGRLWPFMRLGAADTAEAAERHARLLGGRPTLAPGDAWVWNAERQTLASQRFGSAHAPRLPRYADLPAAEREAGLFRALSGLDLSFRFVDEGVRVHLVLTPK